MGSVILDRVAFGYAGGDEVLRDVSVGFTQGWTAIVGENGAGKTTLLELAIGALAPTRGTITRRGVATIAVVDQRVDAAGADAAALAVRDDGEAARWRAWLGLEVEEVARWETLSPGERRRWQLAGALARSPDVLVVDEPTNHLDAEALARCARWLARFDGIGLVVSHDRALVDALATRTVRVHGRTARLWPGGYSAAHAAWEHEEASARARRSELAEARRGVERQLAAARRREEGAARGRSAGARMKGPKDSDGRSMGRANLAEWAAASAGQAVHRLHARAEAARAAEAAVQVERARGGAVVLDGETAPRRWVVALEGALRVGERVLASGLSLAVGRADRIWLRGDNGAGKTTLLRALAQASTLPAERVVVLPQDMTAEAGAALAAELRGLDAATRGRLGQLADALGMDPTRALGSARPSPGEVRKLALALGLARRPWLVLLDEPTNHLDVASVERLEAALAGYGGALVMACHDRRFGEAIATRQWTLVDGAVREGARGPDAGRAAGEGAREGDVAGAATTVAHSAR